MKKAFSHKVPQNIGRTRKAGFLRWFSLRGRFRNPNRAKRSAALPLPRPYWQSAQPSSAQWRKAFHEKTQLPGMMVKPYTVDSGNSLASYRMQSCDWIGFVNLVEFSIRAPCEGSDPLGVRAFLGQPISIHAPARGATDRSRTNGRPTRHFNPRSREGSDKELGIDTATPDISIHAPARGATRCSA